MLYGSPRSPSDDKLRGREDITVAIWNVRTLRAAGKVEGLLPEVNRYKWSILGLCEMRWKKWKSTQLRIRFDLEKLNDPTVMSAFQVTIDGRFAPLATLVDEDADLDVMVTNFNKAVTDRAAELLGKQRRKRMPRVTPEILDLGDQRRDLEKKETRARMS